MKLFELAKQIGLPTPVLIDQIRAYAIREVIPMEVINFCKEHNIYVPPIRLRYKNLTQHFQDQVYHWNTSHQFHLQNRLRGESDFDELIKLFPEYTSQTGLREYLTDKYDLSILPLNLSTGLENAVRYFLPTLGYQSKPDPYAVKHEESVIIASGQKGKFYVATRKPKYATYLLTLTVPWSEDPTRGTFLCPIGCQPCYRGIETRNRKNLVITEIDEELMSSKVREQTEALLRVWDPNVYDILVSGGEPLLFPNRIWKESIIDVLKQAPYLRSFRICTGALGLGLFTRFDEDLLDMLVSFRDECNVQVAINAHIAHPEQLTPEMINVAWWLSEQRIRIMPQVPLVEGVNFWNRDLVKTVALLRRLAHLSTFLLNEPIYKFIIDMQGSVSLLQAIRVQRALFERHQRESNIVRPISFELFLEHATGNLNMSYHTLFAMTMSIDKARSVTIYNIPHAAGGTVRWEEPLIGGINDDERFLQQAITEPPVEE